MANNQLLGLETEYAIRFSPAPNHEHPGNKPLYRALKQSIESLVKTRPGDRNFFQEQFFVENGGAFGYEHLPYAYQGGLIEGATPECSSPSELLLYQRAQEALLVQALPLAKIHLSIQGIEGELGLVKNCKDAEGHIYGAQENYETQIASGTKLSLFRLTTAFVLPFCFLMLLFYFGSTIAILLSFLAVYLITMSAHSCIYLCLKLICLPIPYKSPKRWIKKYWHFGKTKLSKMISILEDEDKLTQSVGKLERYLSLPLMILIFAPYMQSIRFLAFVQQRKQMESFLISRVVISGAGTLLEDGTFALSEKGTAVKRLVRLSIGPNDRPLFDFGNLAKEIFMAAIQLFTFRLGPVKQLFQPRKRLQLGLSDSNRAQFAEYLKVGTTQIILEMANKGLLNNAPKLKRPIEALQTFVNDPTLKSLAECQADLISAIDIQHWFLNQAKSYVLENKTANMEHAEIIKMWEETLDLLVKDPSALIGRLDWISKRYLIETAGQEANFEVKKKIDIAYHELGSGYFDILENKGVAPRIVSTDAINTAVKQPSSPERVRLRSRLIRNIAYKGQRVTISWNSVRIGNFWKGKVISLADFKEKNKQSHT